MKTITGKEANALMNGMAFVLANFNEELGITIENIEEFTRKAFVAYCDCEGIEAVEEEK